MIVHIFTIKICGMVNEIIISTYEIVNFRIILIFVRKNHFLDRRGEGYLKCLRGYWRISQMSTRGRGGSTWFVHSPKAYVVNLSMKGRGGQRSLWKSPTTHSK